MVKVPAPEEFGFSADVAVIVIELGFGAVFGAVYVIIAVSPFPALPLFVGLLSVPHAGEQEVPLLVSSSFHAREVTVVMADVRGKDNLCPRGNRRGDAAGGTEGALQVHSSLLNVVLHD
jgi:hypothetical protein